MNAMVTDGKRNNVFGCRPAGPDEFKQAKNTCRTSPIAGAFTATKRSNEFKKLNMPDWTPKIQAAGTLSPWANEQGFYP